MDCNAVNKGQYTALDRDFGLFHDAIYESQCLFRGAVPLKMRFHRLIHLRDHHRVTGMGAIRIPIEASPWTIHFVGTLSCSVGNDVT